MAKKTELQPEDQQTLAQLMHVRKSLTMQLQEDGGEITDSMIKVWEDNSIAIPAKIDGYGYVIDRMTAENAYLDAEIEQIKQAKTWNENQIKKMKQRLSFFADGQKLEGHRYSFTPDFAVSRTVNMDRVPKTVGKYKVEDLTFEELYTLQAGLQEIKKLCAGVELDKINALMLKIATSEHKCGVKEAPADAILSVSENTVRIGRKGSRTKTGEETNE